MMLMVRLMTKCLWNGWNLAALAIFSKYDDGDDDDDDNDDNDDGDDSQVNIEIFTKEYHDQITFPGLQLPVFQKSRGISPPWKVFKNHLPISFLLFVRTGPLKLEI